MALFNDWILFADWLKKHKGQATSVPYLQNRRKN
jgi:hypothetical protein